MEYVKIVLKIDFKKVSIIFSGSSPAEGEKPTSGVLTSPNYPAEYPNNVDLVQKIEVPEGNSIRMRFTDFDCEEGPDWLEVHDVMTSWQNGSLLWERPGLSGSKVDRDFVSYRNKVEVVFRTDGSVTARGWRLEWSEYSVISNKSILFNVVLQTWLKMRRACQRVGS